MTIATESLSLINASRTKVTYCLSKQDKAIIWEMDQATSGKQPDLNLPLVGMALENNTPLRQARDGYMDYGHPDYTLGLPFSPQLTSPERGRNDASSHAWEVWIEFLS